MANKQAEAAPATLSDKQVAKLLDAFRVTKGKGFRLADHRSDDPIPGFIGKQDAKALLSQGVEHLSALQNLLYANGTWSLLLVFQAMDAAGKDGTIKHVMSGVNPQGVSVTSFKQPGPDDLAHDFLWRVSRSLPGRGMIGIFNRSHYEEVLIARVHPEIVDRQRIPASLAGDPEFWDRRLDDIAAFERHLARQGTRILKFFLDMSFAEQKRRFLSRLDEPEKNWKFSAADITERAYWTKYMTAYEAAIAGTATEEAPWFIVPADKKWFARLVVVSAINDALLRLDLKPVQVAPAEKQRLEEARARLEAPGA